MTPIELITLLVLTSYAIYRQSIRHVISARTRFKMPLLYAGAGLIYGGFYLPPSALSWTMLIISILLSLIVGYARGRLTQVWIEDGQYYVQGTALTIALFIGLIASKYVIGGIEFYFDISPHGGFGEVLFIIAIMMAFQAEMVWRRAQRLAKHESHQS